MLKLIKRHHNELWLQSTSTFEQQTGITLKLVIEKTLCRQMRHRVQQFWKLLSVQIQSQRIKPEFQKRTPNSIRLWSKHFWKPTANVSSRSKKKEHQFKTWNTVKKTRSNNWANYIYQYNQVKENLHPVSIVYVWTTLEHQVKSMYAFRKHQNSFWSSQSKNTLQARAQPRTRKCLTNLH